MFLGLQGVDWNNLIMQKSCFVPTFDSPEDTSYFETRKPTSQESMIADFTPSSPMSVATSAATSDVESGRVSSGYGVRPPPADTPPLLFPRSIKTFDC